MNLHERDIITSRAAGMAGRRLGTEPRRCLGELRRCSVLTEGLEILGYCVSLQVCVSLVHCGPCYGCYPGLYYMRLPRAAFNDVVAGT